MFQLYLIKLKQEHKQGKVNFKMYNFRQIVLLNKNPRQRHSTTTVFLCGFFESWNHTSAAKGWPSSGTNPPFSLQQQRAAVKSFPGSLASSSPVTPMVPGPLPRFPTSFSSLAIMGTYNCNFDTCFSLREQCCRDRGICLRGSYMKNRKCPGKRPKDVLVWFQTKVTLLFIFLRVICLNKLYKRTVLHVFTVN